MSAAEQVIAKIAALRDANEKKDTEKWFNDIADKLRSKVERGDPLPSVVVGGILPREKIAYLTRAGLEVELVDIPADPNCPCAGMACTCGEQKRTIIRLR